ncbi:hypothetical protein PC116_g3700 [Phytophthora cactorum]|uniref:Uncharacterized protein n=1 Tax=Phytophthora cactorum TaxID=29920 RepID=A0A8T1EM40_9STRA|nr:hypothetical protein Pcac1_g14266 [Phytophthora cactorum]KAG2927526.1 hypothetical protein PC114_g3443 [Phytophthora cactorum]KAG2953664.1 hypothetical protein PC117_g1824 [Phytophthora cactorum]KAG3032120.1 hypothetical protein PC120_g2682 [Phytophthora cactorum]KAG3037528.1 hypothetical protein PC119_g3552 [Phytophthora cactorum]
MASWTMTQGAMSNAQVTSSSNNFARLWSVVALRLTVARRQF